MYTCQPTNYIAKIFHLIMPTFSPVRPIIILNSTTSSLLSFSTRFFHLTPWTPETFD